MSAWAYILLGGILIVIGGIMAGYGWHIMPKENKKIPENYKVESIVTSKGQRGGITAQQITINNYFQKDEMREEIERKELKQKYPLGYAIFAVDDTTINIPKDDNYGNEFIINWEKAKATNLEQNTITIVMPDITYKPLQSSIIGMTMVIPRKVSYEIKLPFKFKDQSIIPIIELLEDHGDFVVLVLGFKKKF